MSEKFYQLKISTDVSVNELIVGFLSNVSAEGFVEEGDGVSCYFESSKWDPVFETNVERFLNSLKLQNKIGDFVIDVSVIENQDWNKRWEDSVMPVEVTDDIVIKPSWKSYTGNARIVIEIDPKMSFGTGHHETTRMMVQMLSKYIKGKERVLDLGTGTGVLAIAAVKLGARMCVAVDKDEWSIENARENVERNKVSRQIKIVPGELAAVNERDFDLVSANLNRNTLLYLREELFGQCKTGGKLLLAGILTLDESDVVRSFKEVGFKLVETMHESEWSALAFSK